jgi:hypothetical protein
MDLAGSNSHYTSAHCSGQVPRSHGNWQAVNLLNHQSVIEGSYIRVYIYTYIYIYSIYIHTLHTTYIYTYQMSLIIYFFLKKRKTIDVNRWYVLFVLSIELKLNYQFDPFVALFSSVSSCVDDHENNTWHSCVLMESPWTMSMYVQDCLQICMFQIVWSFACLMVFKSIKNWHCNNYNHNILSRSPLTQTSLNQWLWRLSFDPNQVDLGKTFARNCETAEKWRFAYTAGSELLGWTNSVLTNWRPAFFVGWFGWYHLSSCHL